MPTTAKKTAAPPRTMTGLRDRLSKKYGDGRVTRRESVTSYEVIPTGSLSLDLATGVGGIVVGRITEIVGVEGTGKTTLCINIAREAQSKYPDKAAGIIDMEQTFDWDWAEANGLNTSDERFLHVFPDNSEDVSDQIKEMMETGLFSVIFVDSIGGMESRQAFDKDAEEHVMGRNAQVITRMSKRLAMLARRHKCAVVLVNQYRANLSSPQGGDISAGPKAMKYATTMKIETRQVYVDPIKVKFPDYDEPLIVGKKVAAKVSRNKVAPDGKKGEFWIINRPSEEYGPVGIDRADEALTIGMYAEVIEQQPGGYYVLPWTVDKKDRIHGRPALLTYLRANPDKAAQIRDVAVAKVADQVVNEPEVHFDPVTGEVLDEVSA